jgi:hypothetical protein
MAKHSQIKTSFINGMIELFEKDKIGFWLYYETLF